MTRPRGTVQMTGVTLPSPDEIAGTGRYECPVCKRRYSTIGAKKRHMKGKHPRA